MDPTTVSLDWTSILSNQGPIVALLGLAVLYLKKELEKREKRLETILEKVTGALEESSKVVAVNTESQRECRAHHAHVVKVLESLVREGGNNSGPLSIATSPGG